MVAQSILAAFQDKERSAFAGDCACWIFRKRLERWLCREIDLSRQTFEIGAAERRRERPGKRYIGTVRLEVADGVHQRRSTGQHAGVHNCGCAAERAFARYPRYETVSGSEQKRCGIGYRERFDQLFLHFLERVLGCRREKAADDVDSLVDDGGVLQPVDGGRVEGWGVAETHRAIYRFASVRAHGGIGQSIERKLRCEVEILILAGVHLARKVLHRGHA